MTDVNHTRSEPAKCWPTFPDGQTITGMKLFDVIKWVSASGHVLDGCAGPENMPIIAMPSMQRTAVLRPKQVLDLWDSLMRGLPIGAFYLVEQREGIHEPVRLGGAHDGPLSMHGFQSTAPKNVATPKLAAFPPRASVVQEAAQCPGQCEHGATLDGLGGRTPAQASPRLVNQASSACRAIAYEIFTRSAVLARSVFGSSGPICLA